MGDRRPLRGRSCAVSWNLSGDYCSGLKAGSDEANRGHPGPTILISGILKYTDDANAESHHPARDLPLTAQPAQIVNDCDVERMIDGDTAFRRGPGLQKLQSN